MSNQKQSNDSRARVLAFIATIAILVAAIVPSSQPVLAGGGGGNDTINGAPAGGTETTTATPLKSVVKEDESGFEIVEPIGSLDVVTLWNVMLLML